MQHTHTCRHRDTWTQRQTRTDTYTHTHTTRATYTKQKRYMMEPNFDYNNRNFKQELRLVEEGEKREQNEKFFSNYGLYVDDEDCEPSYRLLEYMKQFRDIEKNFISNFGDDVKFLDNGYKVTPCKTWVRYDAVKTAIRKHTKYCRNCRLRNILLWQKYECFRSMVRSNTLRRQDGYVMDYTHMTGDYLKHCHDSIMPTTYDEFCIN